MAALRLSEQGVECLRLAGQRPVGTDRVSGGANVVDFGRFKNRDRSGGVAWDSTVFRVPASSFRDVVLGPVAFTFDDAGVGMME